MLLPSRLLWQLIALRNMTLPTPTTVHVAITLLLLISQLCYCFAAVANASHLATECATS